MALLQQDRIQQTKVLMFVHVAQFCHAQELIDFSFKEVRLQKEKNAVIITKDLLLESFQTYNVANGRATIQGISYNVFMSTAS